MKRRTAIVLLLAAAGGILCLPLFARVAVATPQGRVLWCAPAGAAGFALEYIHSVNKGAVCEQYTLLRGGALMLQSATFESYGAGMPDQLPPGATMAQRENYIEIAYAPNTLPQLRLIPGSIAQHVLVCGGQRVPLHTLSPYSMVLIGQRRLSALQLFFFGKGMNVIV